MTISPPPKPGQNQVIEVKSGAAYFFNRDKPDQTQFQTPSSSGAIRGTEFNLVVAEDGSTTLNPFGQPGRFTSKRSRLGPTANWRPAGGSFT